MDILKGIESFIDGIRSVVNVSTIVEQRISVSVADGVENGLERSIPSLMKAGLTLSLLVTGVILTGYGAGRALESALNYPGLGYLMAGALILFLGGALYFRKTRKD